MVVADSQVKKLIGNPKVTSAELLDFIADVLLKGGRGTLDGKMRNFFEELLRNRRLALLPEVAAMFAAMRSEAENVTDIQVTSAVALNDAQRNRLADALKKRFQKDVRLQCDVDAALIGGAVIRSGDLVIDGSLRARLAALSNAMAQ